MTRNTLDSVVEEIYQAAFDSGSFQSMFQQICAVLDAPQGCVMVVGSGSRISYIHNINPDSQKNYNTAYVGQDPWYQRAVARGLQHVVVTGQELLPTREFSHTGFYQDVLACSDIYDCMSITLEDNGSDNAGMIIHRTRKQPVFGQKEKDIFNAFVPHLRRMIRMRRRLEESQLMHGINEQILDQIAFGLVLLDRNGLIRQANRSAEAIFSAQDGLGTRHGRLTAAHPDDDKRLETAINRALGKAPGPASGGELGIRRKSGKSSYALQVNPFTPKSNDLIFLGPGNSARGAWITITDPDQKVVPSVRSLQQLYGLTPTEAKVAIRLVAERSVRDIADELGISQRTVRWHVKNMLEKNSMKRIENLAASIQYQISVATLEKRPSNAN